MDIKVFGPGCKKCEQTEVIVKAAVAELGVDATVEKVSDLKKIMEYKVVSTPAVAVDGKLVISGRVPTLDEAKSFIKGTPKPTDGKGGGSCCCGGKC